MGSDNGSAANRASITNGKHIGYALNCTDALTNAEVALVEGDLAANFA